MIVPIENKINQEDKEIEELDVEIKDLKDELEECNICIEKRKKYYTTNCNKIICNKCMKQMRKLKCPFCFTDLDKNKYNKKIIKKIEENVNMDKILYDLENELISIYLNKYPIKNIHDAKMIVEAFLLYLSNNKNLNNDIIRRFDEFNEYIESINLSRDYDINPIDYINEYERKI